MSDWRIFKGNAKEPHDGIHDLPDPPPWRPWHKSQSKLPDREIIIDPNSQGNKFIATQEMIQAVNAALYLRRPLLLTGKAGSGKSTLIEAVAWELKLGKVLRWSITSRSTLKEALYEYDALGRLQEQQLRGRDPEGYKFAPEIGDFMRLGPLGTALLPTKRPRALLIDEIDKADIDLPNDLLNVFERGQYPIPELQRLKDKDKDIQVREYDSDMWASIHDGKVACFEFPFVVLTSNGEREFSEAFLRRCIRFNMPDPNEETLTAIVKSHLGDNLENVEQRIHDFAERSKDRALATDQLLNAIFLVTRAKEDTNQEREAVVELLLKELNVRQYRQ